MKKKKTEATEVQALGAHSRRTFLKSLGTAAVGAAAARAQSVADELGKVNAEKVIGPGPVPVTLSVNGAQLNLTLEPRVTLLDALRNYSSLTGAKEGCDRAACGACTVLLDGLPIYSCQKLAIEAQGRDITTVEALDKDGQLSRVQRAFIERDALQCGYCTPGFVMSVTALLAKNPRPTDAQVRHACSGNLCRCGAHQHIIQAALDAVGMATPDRTEVVNG